MKEQTFIERRLAELCDQVDKLGSVRLREMLTVEDVAAELACSTDVVYRLIRAGHLPAVRHRGTSRGTWVRRTDLVAYVEGLDVIEPARHLEAVGS